MAIINFENIVDDDEVEDIPDGYRNLNWKNFWAWDDDIFPGPGFGNVLHSGEAVASNSFENDKAERASFKSADPRDEFDLN